MFNNRQAPRFSNRKYRHNIISKELYDAWRKQTGYKITITEFRRIWRLIAKEYINEIIEEKDGAKLGASIGDLYIGYVPSPKHKPIDYNTSLELGKKVHFQNWNSNGKLGKIIYGTRGRKYIYRLYKFWSFKACRTFKQQVNTALREHPERYKNSIEKRSLL